MADADVAVLERYYDACRRGDGWFGISNGRIAQSRSYYREKPAHGELGVFPYAQRYYAAHSANPSGGTGRAADGEAGTFFFQAEDGIRDVAVTGVQTCALPI